MTGLNPDRRDATVLRALEEFGMPSSADEAMALARWVGAAYLDALRQRLAANNNRRVVVPDEARP